MIPKMYLALLLYVCLSSTRLTAQTLSPDSSTVPHNDNPLLTHTDSIVQQAAAGYFRKHPRAVGLIVGVSNRGKRTYYGYGRFSKDNPALPDANTIFEIGSITKTFTSLLLAKAVTENRVSLNDPVQKYLPAGLKLDKDGKDITLVELSNHSSGLPRMMHNFMQAPGFNMNDPYKTYSRQLLLDELGKNGPQKTPGAGYDYSNLGAALLGLAMETVYKTPYAKLVQEKIFTPLKMTRSFVGAPIPADPNTADGYSEKGDTVSHWSFDAIAPAGAIRSPAKDMLNYLEAQLNDPGKAFALSHQPTIDVNKQLSVALSWHIISVAGSGQKIIWHNGGTGGCNTFGGFREDNGTAVIVMGNLGVPNATDGVGVEILKQLDRP